jgi:hypothetical protein
MDWRLFVAFAPALDYTVDEEMTFVTTGRRMPDGNVHSTSTKFIQSPFCQASDLINQWRLA